VSRPIARRDGRLARSPAPITEVALALVLRLRWRGIFKVVQNMDGPDGKPLLPVATTTRANVLFPNRPAAGALGVKVGNGRWRDRG